MNQLFKPLFGLFIYLILSGCQEELYQENFENNPPESFSLSPENFSATYDDVTFILSVNWLDVFDPDGDDVIYDLFLNSQLIGENLSISQTSISDFDNSLLSEEILFTVVAKDPFGLTSESSITVDVEVNHAPSIPENLVLTPTFYGGYLSWSESTDPDEDELSYYIDLDGALYAREILDLDFIINTLSDGSSYSLSVYAVDEYGNNSEKANIDLETLQKEAVNSQSTTVNVLGLVLDDNDIPLEGASVTFNGETIITNEYGLFFFPEKEMQDKNELLVIEGEGYFTAYNLIDVANSDQSFSKIKLLKKEVIGQINSQEGGSVSSTSGYKVSLPANAIENYNGQVSIALGDLDPTNDDFLLESPNLFAYNTQGEIGTLLSYGMAAIELLDLNGEELKLKSGAKAIIEFPIEQDLLASSPESIALWSFDIEEKAWVQEGFANLENGKYIGEVQHFSFWNCDIFNETREVSYFIKGENGEIISNAYVEFVLGNGFSGSGYTDSEGNLFVNMPTNLNYQADIYLANQFTFSDNDNEVCESPITLNNLSIPPGNEMYSVDLIIEPTHFVTISGSVNNCDGNLVEGSLIVLRDLNNQILLFDYSDNEGKFNLHGGLCAETDSNLEILAFDMINSNYSEPESISVTSADNSIHIDDPLETCAANLPDFNDVEENLYPGTLWLQGDEEVLDFVNQGYTGVDGGLFINNVTTLEPLNVITEVTGLFDISSPHITTLLGLGQLKDGSRLTITSDQNLIDISTISETWAFGDFTLIGSNLQEVTFPLFERGGLKFLSCENLETITLPSFQSGNLEILHNEEFTTLNAPNLNRIEGDLEFFGCGKLLDINLDTLNRIDGELIIRDNEMLEQISFPNLTIIEDTQEGHPSLDIQDNNNLSSLSFNEELNSQDELSLKIINNENLNSDLSFNFTYLEKFEFGTVTNQTNFNIDVSFPFLEDADVIIVQRGINTLNLPSIQHYTGTSLIIREIENNLSLPNLESTINGLEIVEYEGESLSLPSLINSSLEIDGATMETLNIPNLTNSDVFILRAIRNLAELPSFESLENVSFIKLSLLNAQFDAFGVSELSGFNSIQNLDQLIIENNRELETISGFNNLNQIQENLTIELNGVLTNFCGFPTDLFNENNLESVEIIDNEYNPSTEELLAGNCTP